MSLLRYFPSYQALEAAAPAQVAQALLAQLVTAHADYSAVFNLRNIISGAEGQFENRWECGRAVAEALSWMSARGFIAQAPRAELGWIIVTRAGRAAAEVSDLAAWSADRELPETLLHPVVVRESMDNFRQGKFDIAVFAAFRALEVSIRSAAGLGNEAIGVPLASRAFHPEDGPLTDAGSEGGERTALMKLMTGAIGYLKNPTSHREVELGAQEAREMLVVASFLHRIVDSRAKGRQPEGPTGP
jgi:uncharacterized protein (TIGR02391 family)